MDAIQMQILTISKCFQRNGFKPCKDEDCSHIDICQAFGAMVKFGKQQPINDDEKIECMYHRKKREFFGNGIRMELDDIQVNTTRYLLIHNEKRIGSLLRTHYNIKFRT